jgi:hypothetical protein
MVWSGRIHIHSSPTHFYRIQFEAIPVEMPIAAFCKKGVDGLPSVSFQYKNSTLVKNSKGYPNDVRNKNGMKAFPQYVCIYLPIPYLQFRKKEIPRDEKKERYTNAWKHVGSCYSNQVVEIHRGEMVKIYVVHIYRGSHAVNKNYSHYQREP